MSTMLTGQLPVTVQLLNTEQARLELPDHFEGSRGSDEESFNELPPTGNADWLDFWPEHVLVIRTLDGQLVQATAANDWHMTDLGLPVAPNEG